MCCAGISRSVLVLCVSGKQGCTHLAGLCAHMGKSVLDTADSVGPVRRWVLWSTGYPGSSVLPFPLLFIICRLQSLKLFQPALTWGPSAARVLSGKTPWLRNSLWSLSCRFEFWGRFFFFFVHYHRKWRKGLKVNSGQLGVNFKPSYSGLGNNAHNWKLLESKAA